MNFRRSVASLFSVFAILLLFACSGGGSTTASPPTAAPTITSFVSSPLTIAQGQTAQLTAVFSNGAGVILT